METLGSNIMSHIDLNQNGSNPFLPVLPVKAVQVKYNNKRLRHRAWMIEIGREGEYPPQTDAAVRRLTARDSAIRRGPGDGTAGL